MGTINGIIFGVIVVAIVTAMIIKKMKKGG